MKLGEALNLRADLQTRLSLLGKRLKDSALLQEGDQPAEEFQDLLRELDQLCEQMQLLISRINHTNSSTRLPNGETLTEALARQWRELDSQIQEHNWKVELIEQQ